MLDTSSEHTNTSMEQNTTSGDDTLANPLGENIITLTSKPEADGSSNKTNVDFAQHTLDRTLRFLANASNETLIAYLVGLAAATYFVLGRIGLVLIGILIGTLCGTWREHGGISGVGDRDKGRRREASLSIITRILDRRGSEKDDKAEEKTGLSSFSKESGDFARFPEAVRRALSDLTEAVVRDYVKYAPCIHYQAFLT